MLSFRRVTSSDVNLLFDWTNDPETRNNSFNNEPIPYEEHVAWFNHKINDANALLLLFYNPQNEPIGLVRFDHKKDHTIISISIDKDHRGKGHSTEMLKLACVEAKKSLLTEKILAYVHQRNQASNKSFMRSGFQLEKVETVNNIISHIYTLSFNK